MAGSICVMRMTVCRATRWSSGGGGTLLRTPGNGNQTSGNAWHRAIRRVIRPVAGGLRVVRNDDRGNVGRHAKVADIVSLTVRVLRAGIVRCAFVRRIGRDVRGDGEGDVLCFPKQREQ